MKMVKHTLKLVISFIVSTNLIVAGIPAPSRSNSFLAPPTGVHITPKMFTDDNVISGWIISNLQDYLKVEGRGIIIKYFQNEDDEFVKQILSYGDTGVKTLINILHKEEKAWMRAKAVVALGKLYLEKPSDEIINALIKRSSEDDSVLVRSLIARLALGKWIAPEINEIKPDMSKTINEHLGNIDLNPWPRRCVLRVLDVGCECGVATFNMLEYYKTKEKIVDIAVVGVDHSMAAIIEAEKVRLENNDEQNVIFIYGDIDNDIIGPADIVIQQNKLVYMRELENHADSLIRQVNSDGGALFFSPSISNTDWDSGGDDGIKRLWKMERVLKEKLPGALVKKYQEGSTKDNLFEGNSNGDPFHATWGGSCGWVKAQMPAKITVKTTDKAIHLSYRYFSDGEINIRILNPELIENKDIEVHCSIESADDLVKIVLLLDLLRLPVYGVKGVNLILKNKPRKANSLLNLLRYYCNHLSEIKEGREIPLPIDPSKPIEKKDIPIEKLNTVLCHRKRLISDANDVARSMEDPDLTCKTISIRKTDDNPLNWKASVQGGLHKNDNVALIHSCDTNEDIAELWVMLSALRQMGVGSITLINTYEGYARQDKLPGDTQFKRGEGVSALTMLRTADLYADYHMAFNVHYAKNPGLTELNGHWLYNLNMFVPIAERLFEELIHRIGLKNIKKELRTHPLLLVAPDDGAFPFIEKAAQQLEVYIRAKYHIDIKVEYGYFDKTRLDDKTVAIKDFIIRKDGTTFNDVNKYWIFVIDDEISRGSTLLQAIYVLVKKLKGVWQRIYTGAVHGKFAGGLGIFDTGLNIKTINTAKKPLNVDETEKFMPPRDFPFTTRSATLPKNYPQQQIISVKDMIYHALRHILLGKPSKAGTWAAPVLPSRPDRDTAKSN